MPKIYSKGGIVVVTVPIKALDIVRRARLNYAGAQSNQVSCLSYVLFSGQVTRQADKEEAKSSPRRRRIVFSCW
jgi:hypothetical protein